jgi:threonyl-tRNA synthetase
MGVLIEHYAGAFPLWLAPVQVEVMSISEKHIDYANKIYAKLTNNGFRVKLNVENEKIGYKIRQATLNKVPYMVIVGDKEVENNAITVRTRDGENFELIEVEKFINSLSEEIKAKKQIKEVKK